ncbi:hypothetical protein GCM10009430_32570 [Aquimarina litoralis]|uniref:Integrase catalytic domain-containing protein n=1 Tax=Aquimarina litoralis TaxID=584605 RepID=A0ABP3U7B4_9FLAO
MFRQKHNTNIFRTRKTNANGYIERFNRTFREDVLDAYLFHSRKQFQMISDETITDYNNNHPHESLGGESPREFGKRKIPLLV